MEQNILDFIDHHVATVGDLERDVNQAYWDFATTGAKRHENRLVEKSKALKGVFADRQRYIRVRTYDDEKMATDPVTARQIRLLRLRYTANQIPLDVIDRLVEHETAVARLVDTFRATVDGEKLSSTEILDRLAASKKSAERRVVWEATKRIGDDLGPAILRLVGLRNRAARDLGYRDYYDMSLKLQEIDEGWLFRTIDDLVQKTDKPFRAAKAQLDSETAKKFKCRPGELRPWHYADPFFQEITPAREFDLDRFYKRKDLEKLTRETFAGHGLDVRDVLKRSDLVPREGKDQHAFCLHVDRRTDDVRVLCNNARSENWMSTMLHEFGHAAYDKYLGDDLPYLLREASHTLLSEAVAMFYGRLSRAPEFLKEVVSADRATVTRATRDLNEYSRMKMLLKARWVPVMAYFERSLYEDPGRDLNRLWWDLSERIQFLKRPDGRRTFDWATKNHLAGAPVHYHNHLLGELVASQLKASIQRATGKAAIIGNKGVGKFLQERLFSLGARHHFQDTLVLATGEKLSAHWFLEEYCSG